MGGDKKNDGPGRHFLEAATEPFVSKSSVSIITNINGLVGGGVILVDDLG